MERRIIADVFAKEKIYKQPTHYSAPIFSRLKKKFYRAVGFTISSISHPPGEGWLLKKFCYNCLDCDYGKSRGKQDLFSFQDQLFFFLAYNISTQLNMCAYTHTQPHLFLPGGGVILAQPTRYMHTLLFPYSLKGERQKNSNKVDILFFF